MAEKWFPPPPLARPHVVLCLRVLGWVWKSPVMWDNVLDFSRFGGSSAKDFSALLHIPRTLLRAAMSAGDGGGGGRGGTEAWRRGL